MMTVIEEIAAERRRQIEVEGWTPEHDDEHAECELAAAAACYAACAAGLITPTILGWLWAWSRDWWKPKNPRRDLIRSGALIVAEIERLDRAAAKQRAA